MDDGKELRNDLGAKDDGNEIALLEEELIHLSVKSSIVDPFEKPTLICSVWTRKNYNLDSLRAQVRSIWKTKKQFEIMIAGQNLFKIVFEDEEDLEQIMNGRPCHMGYGIKDCLMLSEGDRSKAEDELPFSVALKAEFWRRFSSKESFDANMAGMIMGKRKFNHEKLDDIESYLSDDVKTKRANFDSICSADFATTEPSCFVLTDVSDPSQIILTAAKWQAD
ncbi:hypothetical protein PVK06_001738 [Gossypium arboreum]|uniref:DUF4283 domain-containing protein n=1 Tax=Gossypium arboreum TaxID=29729 RepID=A0ABR0R1W3_GOSAR|nr:hypothetical protein PVK06_001738 [Gossypium arboreum]